MVPSTLGVGGGGEIGVEFRTLQCANNSTKATENGIVKSRNEEGDWVKNPTTLKYLIHSQFKVDLVVRD